MHAIGVHDPTKATQQLACHHCCYNSSPDHSCASVQITCRPVKAAHLIVKSMQHSCLFWLEAWYDCLRMHDSNTPCSLKR